MKITSLVVGVALLTVASQAFSQRMDHPFIKCNEFEVLANVIMSYRVKGADQEKLVRAMQRTGEDPHFGIQANIGLKMIEKAFAVDVPKNADGTAKAKIVADFTNQQKQFCEDLLDGKIKIN